jgi:hypothetical protein
VDGDGDLHLLKKMQENKKVVSIDSYEMVPPNNEKALQKAVANKPVSVAINAASPAFQHYTSVSIGREGEGIRNQSSVFFAPMNCSW